jgi:hypothetical protein
MEIWSKSSLNGHQPTKQVTQCYDIWNVFLHFAAKINILKQLSSKFLLNKITLDWKDKNKTNHNKMLCYKFISKKFPLDSKIN